MRSWWTPLAISCFFTLPAHADEKPGGAADALSLGAHAATLEAFVPAGFAIEQKLEADLDGDGRDDAVLVLLEAEKAEGADRERLLVVALRRDQGFLLGGKNQGLLLCAGCGGVRGGPPELEVAHGVLSVSQMQGAREFTYRVDRFRYRAERIRFEHIGEDDSFVDAATGEETDTTCNYITRTCFETKLPPQTDADGNPRPRPSKFRSWKLPRRPLRVMEQVRWDE